MKQGANRPWLELAVRADRHRAHAEQAALQAARARSRDAAIEANRLGEELEAVNSAWQAHREQVHIEPSLDSLFRRYQTHAQVQQKTAAIVAKQRSVECDAAELALRDVFARLQAREAVAERLAAADTRDQQRIEVRKLAELVNLALCRRGSAR